MATAPKIAPTLKVKVVRAFYHQGKPLAVGETLTLPSVFAREMIAANKAEPVEAASPATGPDDNTSELNLNPNPDSDKSNPGKRGK